MGILRAMELMEKYTYCPDCGSDSLGNGEGTLVVEENIFTRTCKCGFKVNIKD